MQQMTHELDHDETRSYRHRVGSPLINSPPGNWVHIDSPNNNTFLQDSSRSPTLNAGSPLTNNHFLELPSVLPPRLNSMKVSPIGKEQSWINHAISNSSPTNGILFQHSLSLPEHVGIIPNMWSSPRTTLGPTPIGMMPSMSSSPRTTFSPTSVKMMQGMSSSPRATIGPPTSSEPGVATLTGTQFLWGSPAPYSEHTHSSAWPTSSMGHSFMSNGQKQGFPHSRLVPLSHHHVGSAPSGVPFDKKSGFFSESLDSLFARPVSFGGLGPIGRNDGSLMRKTGVSVSTNFAENGFPGLRMMPSQISGHLFRGSAPYPGPASSGFEGFEHSHSRRADYFGVQLDDKTQYQLELEKIFSGDDIRTTLMIKNIPNKYTSKMLLATIDEKHMGTYDFLYLPIDFKNKCNVGYAFINMVSPSHIIPFYEAFNGKKWEKFNSEKVASLAYARIQGLKALTDHFQDSSVMNEDKLYRPIIFHAEGPDNFYQDRFPPNSLIGSECWQDGKYIGAPLMSPAKNNPEDNPEGRNPSGSGCGDGLLGR